MPNVLASCERLVSSHPAARISSVFLRGSSLEYFFLFWESSPFRRADFGLQASLCAAKRIVESTMGAVNGLSRSRTRELSRDGKPMVILLRRDAGPGIGRTKLGWGCVFVVWVLIH